jgi:hypothetical protein
MVACQSAFSQNDTWQKIYAENGVEFYTKKAECHDIQNGIHEEYFLVQIHNTSANTVNIKWNYHLYSDEHCMNCKENSSDEKYYIITIPSGETVEGNCEKRSQKELLVFSRFLQYKTANPVTRFTVENVNVNFD